MSSFLQTISDRQNYMILKKFEYEWDLQPTDSRYDGKQRSKDFPGAGFGQSWYIQLDNNHTNHGALIFSVRLCFENCPANEKIATKFSFALSNRYREISTRSGCFLFTKGHNQSLPYDLYCDQKYSSLYDDFRISVTVHAEFPWTPMIMMEVSEFKNMRDLFSSLQSGVCSDMVIKVEGREIKCHRCILSCRSTYFSTMFKSGLKESEENCIEITDFKYEIIEAMINFLYFKFPNFSCQSVKFIERLLEAADKYLMSDLREVCETQLIEEINSVTVMGILLHADINSTRRVRKHAIDYICKNSMDFKKAEQYESLLARPELLRDLILAKNNV